MKDSGGDELEEEYLDLEVVIQASAGMCVSFVHTHCYHAGSFLLFPEVKRAVSVKRVERERVCKTLAHAHTHTQDWPFSIYIYMLRRSSYGAGS